MDRRLPALPGATLTVALILTGCAGQLPVSDSPPSASDTPAVTEMRRAEAERNAQAAREAELARQADAKADENEVTDVAPSMTTAPPPVTEPEPTQEEPARTDIKPGDSGPQVTALQERLHELGYGIANPDGQYGPATQQAVWAFQKAAGLSRDGVVGPATQAKLDEGYRPVPLSTSGHVIEIDLTRQILLAVDDGHVTRVINISTGNGEKYKDNRGNWHRAGTPTGNFAVYMAREGNHSSTLGLGGMYRPRYFNGGIAIHGSPSIPTYPASHGCVRVANNAADWLFDSWGVPNGTPVHVHP